MASGPPVTSADDPRLARHGREQVAGEDQIPQMLAATPRERLRWLREMLAFEDRAHNATRLPPER